MPTIQSEFTGNTAASIAEIYAMASHLSDAEGPFTSMTARTTKTPVDEVEKI